MLRRLSACLSDALSGGPEAGKSNKCRLLERRRVWAYGYRHYWRDLSSYGSSRVASAQPTAVSSHVEKVLWNGFPVFRDRFTSTLFSVDFAVAICLIPSPLDPADYQLGHPQSKSFGKKGSDWVSVYSRVRLVGKALGSNPSIRSSGHILW